MPTPTAKDPLAAAPHRWARALRRRWLFWLPPLVGVVALAWFLMRVIPKPSRAAYPCQRAAFPVATGFILWITGLVGAGIAWGKARQLLARARLVPALLCILIAVFLTFQGWNATPDRPAIAAAYAEILQPNHPVGTARGIFPGRVTWVYDRSATTWDGVTSLSGTYKGWWGTSTSSTGDIVSTFTSQSAVNTMISKNLQWLSGTTSDAAAWREIFTYFNRTHSGAARGYQAGEKVFIKTNWVTNSVSAETAANRQYINPSPEILIALLTQLQAAGVNLSNVTMGDTVRDWPQHMYNRIHGAFPNDAIKFIGVHAYTYQTASTQSTDPLYFSNNPTGVAQDYIPSCFEEAAYVINLAQMKTHARNGVTLCAKNYFGAMGRNPNAAGYYNTHKGVLVNSDGGSNATGTYRVLVDLSGHPKIGGNVLLWVMDALYTGYDWSAISPPVQWYSAPFNDGKAGTKDWPSSILMSMDPVAIDSVCLDLWKAEKAAAEGAGHPLPGLSIGCDPTRAGVEDYLVEMAMANAPLSGTVYKPDATHPLASLGAFEHWSPATRQYSRNLGTGLGIELITAQPAVQGRWIFYNNSAWDKYGAAGNGDDDAAIAPDKTPLLPGGTASFLNYTSYSKGINGVMIDLPALPGDQAPDATDFEFTVGNDNAPATWAAAPQPGVTLRRGQGVQGSDRITLIWTDKSITGQWLRIHLKANPVKNLPDDVCYVGNASGDTGNSAGDALVDRTDEARCRADPHNFGNLAAINNAQDFNRDKKVDTTDEFVARTQATTSATALHLIVVP